MTVLLLIGLLFVGGGVAWLTEAWNPTWPRKVSALVLIAAALLTASMLTLHSDVVMTLGSAEGTWMLVSATDWIPRFGITFLFAVDELSLLMLLLTVFLGIVALVASWHEIEQRAGFFHFNLLWTLAGVVGVFTALDLFFFFFFWEVMLIPMYLLIAIWGHENRAYAAMKFFLFTQVSGLLMLVAIVALVVVHHNATGTWTFSYFELVGTPLNEDVGFWLMLGFFVAFVVKLPGFPFHTWLPDAHTQAPTAASVLLAGILLKTGAYGLIRFTVPLFPEASASIAWPAMLLGVAGIVYGAVLAFGQTDFKRLVAYSSVSHMGFVLVGVYAWNQLALQGAVMQMVAHGFSTAALFMIAGALQHRLHTRDMTKMGGLWTQMPRMGAVALFFIVASVGLPGLGNFVGEFLVLLGAFAVSPLIAALAAIGLITGAAYALLAMQRVFHGESRAESGVESGKLEDFGGIEMTVMVLLMLGLTILGVYPQPIFDAVDPVLATLFELGSPGAFWVGSAQ